MASKRISHHTYIISAAAAITLIVGIIVTNKPLITSRDIRTSENTQAAEVNSLANPSFESAGSPIANWVLNVGGGQASLSRDSGTKIDGSVSAKIDISAAGSNSDVQFYQVAPLTNGKQYIIRFSAKASSTRTIDFKMDKGGSSINYFEQSVSLSTNWQQYAYQFTSPADDSSQRYEFNVGGATGQVWIDNATLNTIVNTPAPTPSPSPTASPVRTNSPVPTLSPTPIRTASPSPTPSPTPSRTASPTPFRTASPSPLRTNSPAPNTTFTPPSYTQTPIYTPFSDYQTPLYSPPENADESDTETEDFVIANQNSEIIMSDSDISVSLNRGSTIGTKVYGTGFTITSKGATLWNIKYISHPSGTGFEPSSAIIKSGQTSTVRSFISSSKPNGTYIGKAVLEYYSSGAWHTGPEINYAIGISGSPQSITTLPPNNSIFTSSTINNSPSLEITNPSKDLAILSGQTLPIKWSIKTPNTPINTALLLQKATGSIMNTISDSLNSIAGNNTFPWKVPQLLPGDYQITITTNRDISSTSNNFIIGSRLIIHAGGTPANNIYPTMQLSVNNRVVKTYYGVHGNSPDQQYAQYYYYSSTKILPKNVKISFLNDEYLAPDNDRNLIVDKINIDGIDYQTENLGTSTVYADAVNTCPAQNTPGEWLLCNGFFNY